MLEDKFDMASEIFYTKYSSGELGDAIDYIKWSGGIETLAILKENLKRLSEAEIC